ncbi:MAG: HRDC domain-containing protein [Acidobacteriota bacterium]|nr:HRDC domain-containing protein [Acidobacteriota bacterium]
MVFADSVLHNLVLATPQTLSQLQNVSGIGPRIADNHGADIIALCRGRMSSPQDSVAANKPKIASLAAPAPGHHAAKKSTSAVPYTSLNKTSSQAGREKSWDSAHSSSVTTIPQETYIRSRPAPPDPTEDLTPNQQILNQRLHEWRKAEAEKLGQPLFFIMASTTLRNLVLARPQNLTALKAVQGVGLEKAEKFGPALLQICQP